MPLGMRLEDSCQLQPTFHLLCFLCTLETFPFHATKDICLSWLLSFNHFHLNNSCSLSLNHLLPLSSFVAVASLFDCLSYRDSMMNEMVRYTPNSMMNVTEEEGSDSNSNNLHQLNKRQRHHEASSPRFKGVVFQKNGHWGAQIYLKHQRIWLGTFKSEQEAAMAYDSAAVKIRSEDSHRNFPLNHLTIQEPNFQDLYSTDAILNMIKDGSYQSKFMDFVTTRYSKIEHIVELKLGNECSSDGGYSCQQLFQKELTPSDVGKLNRLVIPKKHAIKYFPQVPEVNSTEDEDAGGVDDVQVVFFDKQMRSWKFRYCYWKSSQSFVFTRGWNRFVKEKELRAKDVITFYRYENSKLLKEQQVFYMIDVEYNGTDISNNLAEESVGKKMGLHLDFRTGFEGDQDRMRREEEEKVVMGLGPPLPEEKKSFKLFGVHIN